MPATSLYHLIQDALQPDGSLPPGFELPKDRSDNKLVFADGAMDGICVYHSSGPGNVDITPLQEAIRQACAGNQQDAVQLAKSYFAQERALSTADVLQDWIRSHQKELAPQPVYSFAYTLAIESSCAEAVKLGLVLLELFDIDSAQVRDTVYTLALCDEFTLFALFIIQEWQDANEVIFHLCQQLHGWGKIHAVQRLEPETEEIRRWIACYGCSNRIMDEYLALTCAEKCGLAGRLAGQWVDRAEFEGACTILKALLADQTRAGPGIL